MKSGYSRPKSAWQSRSAEQLALHSLTHTLQDCQGKFTYFFWMKLISNSVVADVSSCARVMRTKQYTPWFCCGSGWWIHWCLSLLGLDEALCKAIKTVPSFQARSTAPLRSKWKDACVVNSEICYPEYYAVNREQLGMWHVIGDTATNQFIKSAVHKIAELLLSVLFIKFCGSFVWFVVPTTIGGIELNHRIRTRRVKCGSIYNFLLLRIISVHISHESIEATI
jgi:hypothetical protein